MWGISVKSLQISKGLFISSTYGRDSVDAQKEYDML